MEPTLAQAIAGFVETAAVPQAACEASHVAIVDCIGCIIAGAGTDTVQTLAATLEGSHGPATLLGLGRRASLRDAALINGTAAHALDFDDISWTMYGHPTVVVLPPLLALAQAEKRSYADLLDAYAIGVEVAAKLGRWTNPALYLRGWHATSALGILGAAAGAARLMKLSAPQIATSIAIAASQASGIRENFGSMVKPFHAGRAAESALLSAMLARSGFTASEKALDGRFGYFSVLHTETTPKAEEVLRALGAPWEVLAPGIVLKRYASCGATHCALDALLALKQEFGFSGDEISEIRCGAEPLALKVLQYPMPVNSLQAKFSMQFCLAVAAAEGAPRLEHFADAWATNPIIVDLMRRTRVEDRPDLGKDRNDAVPAEVEIILRDGRAHRRSVAYPSGDPRNPMTEAERRAKFLDCVGDALQDGPAIWSSLENLRNGGSLSTTLEKLGPTAPAASA
jgi:2-methylcitrate dehydratase PrpD